MEIVFEESFESEIGLSAFARVLFLALGTDEVGIILEEVAEM